MIRVDRLDHLVLTVASIDASCDFYASVLGMKVQTFSGGRKALSFGNQKINLHQKGHEFEPKATHPLPGSADLCFIAETAIGDVVADLEAAGVAVEEGPVERTGALGQMVSVYFRDPDGNLIEVSNYLTPPGQP
jgi:catechol 2,3-dioxygenase-like lactoylglutathione lyase family enzyme